VGSDLPWFFELGVVDDVEGNHETVDQGHPALITHGQTQVVVESEGCFLRDRNGCCGRAHHCGQAENRDDELHVVVVVGLLC